MRKDYEPYFQILKKSMNNFGYLSLHENELDAEFNLYNGWILEFVCEKYYGPMFSISVITSNFDQKRKKYTNSYFRREINSMIESISYGLSNLKLTFERLKGKCYLDLPENWIESEVAFLSKERETIFSNPEFYEEEYSIIRKLPLAEINAIMASHKAGIVTPAATKPHPEETDS